jgi:hypothetical protein
VGSEPDCARRLQHRSPGRPALPGVHLDRADAGAPLVGLRRTIFDTPQAPHYYDQIAWFTKGQAKRPVLNLDISAGGSFDFVPELQGSSTLLDLSWHISDHFPLWVEFAVPAA